MDWNDEAVVRLREMWTEGLSTAEIGRRLSVSKNAVVGKAHRLNLSARPSPIRRDGPAGEARVPAPRRITGPTLPSMAAPLPVAREPDIRPRPASVDAIPKPMPPTAPVAALRPVPVRPVAPRPARTVACCWPLGEPGTPSFRFCDAEASHGKPYCAAHAAVAYVKLRDRREDAA